VRFSSHRVVTLALCGLLAGGCNVPNFGAFGNEEIPVPTVLATYATGSATLEMNRGDVVETVTFDRVGLGSQLASLMGATVTWRNDSGWVLQVTAFDAMFGSSSAVGPYSGDVVLQLITDHELWRADSYGTAGPRCIVDLDDVSETSVRGTATCKGLRWVDGTAVPGFNNPVYIEGQEPFDAEITFEATP